MSKLGAYSSGAGPIARESYWQISPQVGLAGGENLFAIPTYNWNPGDFLTDTLSRCTLVLDAWAEVDWPGDGSVALWFSIASNSPTPPNGNADNGWNQDCAGVFRANHEMRTHAVWYNITPTTPVTAYARIYSAGGSPVARYIGGFWRPMRM